jgi:hypothetical protein
VDLASLNDRWRAINHPHAVPAEDHPMTMFFAHCPWCGYTGAVSLPLHEAMSDALVHKGSCSQLN